MNKTKPQRTFRPLTIAQERAIDLLLIGKSDAEVAQALHVGRTTVWQWRTEHPLFRATLAQRRAEVWRTAQERLRSLLMTAVENLGKAVEAGDLKASVELLKAVGLYGCVASIGEQHPGVLLQELIDTKIRDATQPLGEAVPRDPLEAMLAFERQPAGAAVDGLTAARIRRAVCEEFLAGAESWPASAREDDLCGQRSMAR
jgi:Homeodomain-like domain